jgi:uncharacterized membrane protein
MALKEKIGLTIGLIVVVTIALLTIALSGHRESLGIMAVALFFLHFAAIILGAILRTFDLFSGKMFGTYAGLLIVTLVSFVLYNARD